MGNNAGIGEAHADANLFHVGKLALEIPAACGRRGHEFETEIDESALHVKEELSFGEVRIEGEQDEAEVMEILLGDTRGKMDVEDETRGLPQLGEHECAGDGRDVDRAVGEANPLAACAKGDPLILLIWANEVLAAWG